MSSENKNRASFISGMLLLLMLNIAIVTPTTRLTNQSETLELFSNDFPTEMDRVEFLDNTPGASGLVQFENDPVIPPIEKPFVGFLENVGQLGSEDICSAVTFYAVLGSIVVMFSPSQVTFVRKGSEDREIISLSFPGASIVEPEGRVPLVHSVNFFQGTESWTGLHPFEEIWYQDLYPGVDLRYFMSDAGLKYEFILDPQVDPAQISLQVLDETSTPLPVEVTPERVLARDPHSGVIFFEEENPASFQTGGTESVGTNFRVEPSGMAYGFELQPYDTENQLVIDPLLLAFSTYIAGDDTESASDVEIGPDGGIYLTGYTGSADFPYTNDSAITGVFVMRFNTTGGLEFSTILGGNDMDRGYGLKVVTDGSIYVCGTTTSTDFPTVNAYMGDPGDGFDDAFLFLLNATGDGLNFSTYLGGDDYDTGDDVAIDAAGNAYITGTTSSTDFPTLNEYQTDPNSAMDAFAAKFTSTGSLVYSTYIGGTSSDSGYAIGVDSEGCAYITGTTYSNDFPMETPYQDTSSGKDAFLTKLNSTGNGLNYSTYFGGVGSETGYAIVVDEHGRAILGGEGQGSTPLVNQTQDYGFGYDGFVSVFNTSGTGLDFSTYIGGSGKEQVLDLTIDPVTGDLYAAGYTESTNFPTKRAYQETDDAVDRDAFIVRYNISKFAPDIFYSSVLGGSGTEQANGVAVKNSLAYIAGRTYSEDFPTLNAYMEDPEAGVVEFSEDVFLSALYFLPDVENLTIEQANPSRIHCLAIDDNPTTWTLYRNGVFNGSGTWANNETFIMSLAGVPDGAYNFTVNLTDVNGHSINASILVILGDLTAPSVPPQPDIAIDEGDAGKNIVWTPTDAFPGYYWIYVDNVQNKTDEWISGDPITFWPNFLSPGVHIIRINVTDAVGNWATDEVRVNVTDTTSPTIIAVGDNTFPEGSIGMSLSWSLADAFPGCFEVCRNGSQVLAGCWKPDSPIEWSLDGLAPGSYNFTINATDATGNWNTDDAIITVEDAFVPTLTHPLDITVVEGASGVAISWQANDSCPATYKIYIDDALDREGSWSPGEDIPLTLNEFTVGKHTCKLVVWDKVGHSTQDEVVVTINALPDPCSDFLQLRVLGQLFTRETFQINVTVTNSSGSTVNGASFSIMWQGVALESSAIEDLGGGVYRVTFPAVLVAPGEDGIPLSFRVTANGYADLSIGIVLVVDPATVAKNGGGGVDWTTTLAIVGVVIGAAVVSVVLVLRRKSLMGRVEPPNA